MTPETDLVSDVLQVCRNGHVITDRLRSCPETGLDHCERCGASTTDRCGTCGREMAGAGPVVGLVPIGVPRPPNFCATCGAAFPWARRPRLVAASLVQLEQLLRRLPRVVRELRWRQGDRPAFPVNDERDLEDLLRSLLPLYFDDVRLESRTPRYSTGTRTDLLLASEGIALTAKLARAEVREPQLAEQWTEDLAHYQQRGECRTLVGYVYDPEGRLHNSQALETAWSRREEEPKVHCIIAVPGGEASSRD